MARIRDERWTQFSHDVRNLVSAILSRTKMLEREVPPEAARRWIQEHANGIRRTGRDLLDLVDAFGGSRRPTRGRSPRTRRRAR
jgi:signal transduction histidine kinase